MLLQLVARPAAAAVRWLAALSQRACPWRGTLAPFSCQRCLPIEHGPNSFSELPPLCLSHPPAETGADDLPSVFWYKLAADARRPRGKMLLSADSELMHATLAVC